jgi:hypothetical protein
MFFGLEWFTALMKISFEIVFSIVTAIPAVIAWNCIAPVYLSFIPKLYQHIPYWHVVAIFLVCTYAGQLINRVVPRIISVDTKVENKK